MLFRSVHEILLLDQQEIKQVSENTIYNYRGTTLPLTTLSSLLDFPPGAAADEDVFLVPRDDLPFGEPPERQHVCQARFRQASPPAQRRDRPHGG